MSSIELTAGPRTGEFTRRFAEREATGWHLGIAAKLLAGFLTLATMLGGVGVFSMVQLHLLNSSSADVTDNAMPSVQALGNFRAGTERFRASQLSLVIANDPQAISAAQVELDQAQRAASAALPAFDSIDLDARERGMFTGIKQQWSSYVTESSSRFLPLVLANRDAEAIMYLQTDGKKLFDGVNAELQPLLDLNATVAADAAVHNRALFVDSQRLIVGSIIAALLAALALGWFLSRMVGRPVAEVTAAIQRLAQGDLSQSINFTSGDELGRMATAARALLVNLRVMVGELQQGSGSLAVAGGEILAATAQQSAGAAEQSAAIAQTTATVDEVRASSEQAAGLATVVSEATQQASRVAGEGVVAVREAVVGMDRSASGCSRSPKTSWRCRSRASRLVKSSPRSTIWPISRTCWR